MKTEAKVGAFVLASLAILILAIIYLMAASSHTGSVPYRAYLHYAGGLEAGTPVLFGGMTAGRITAVRPWTADPGRIEILLDLKPGTPVNEKSVARLGSVSLMSGPALMVSTGSSGARHLAPGAAIPSEDVASMDEILAKVSMVADNANVLMTQVQGELAGVSGDARALLTNLNAMTGKPNQKRINAMLERMGRLVTEERPKIDGMLEQVSRVTAKLGPVVDHADGAIQNINGTVGDMRGPLRNDLIELQTTLNEARGLLANMQVMVRANDSRIDETLENLRITTRNLSDLTDSVKQRPWSLIRVKQPQDRKVPKQE
jgi:phospholipid/cholesterol/gamma-HCH transport system substrate-binding protein